jgi:hypothetical protein
MGLKKPTSRELSERFDDVRHWVQTLHEGSRAVRGFGYEVLWRTHHHRVLGHNELPDGITVRTAEEALRLLGRQRQAERFAALCKTTLARFPALRAWLVRRPLTALAHPKDWPQILAVLQWFQDHPRPGCYLRQLDIPDVDTKFIEARRSLLTELLDAVLPETAIERDAIGVRQFARRYGLRDEPPLIRFRLLDPAHCIQGLSDISLPPDQFAKLSPAIERVFVTENKVNGLAFPDTSRALVIFGLGYGLERLAEVAWLHRVPIHYWGDIDTHGFAILDRLRVGFSQARSFLMDRATLLQHRNLWVREPAGQRYRGSLARLTEDERALFEDLCNDRLGEAVRLEQERIGYRWVQQTLAEIAQRCG